MIISYASYLVRNHEKTTASCRSKCERSASWRGLPFENALPIHFGCYDAAISFKKPLERPIFSTFHESATAIAPKYQVRFANLAAAITRLPSCRLAAEASCDHPGHDAVVYLIPKSGNEHHGTPLQSAGAAWCRSWGGRHGDGHPAPKSSKPAMSHSSSERRVLE
jgi:hypothetical protein